MVMNTFLSFFLTLVTFNPVGYLLPQCTLVAVKIRFTICSHRRLGSELSSTTCRNSPEQLNFPTGVRSWLSIGCPEDILAYRLYVACRLQEPGKFESMLFLGPYFRSDLEVTERPLCVCHWELCLEEMLALGAATFLSNTSRTALKMLLTAVIRPAHHLTHRYPGYIWSSWFSVLHASNARIRKSISCLKPPKIKKLNLSLKPKLIKTLKCLDTAVYQTQKNRTEIQDTNYCEFLQNKADD